MSHRIGVNASLALLLISAQLVGCASSGTSATALAVEASSKKWDGSVLSEMSSRYHPTVGTKGMVVADDREAAEWGAEILRKGGNAIDAAVATAFAMAVTRPHFASLGGGGFLVYCPAPGKTGKKPCQSIDYREEAPAAATRDMFIKDGKPRTDLSQSGALASGVPGVTAGLLMMLEKFGTMPRQKLLSKPIALARGGYLFSGHEESAAQDRWSDMNDEAKRIFGCDSKRVAPCPVNTLIKQPDLARVLETISREGVKGFYEGWVAQKVAAGLQAAGGIMTVADLKAYRAKPRTPVRGPFRGMEVVSMSPPSAGGTVLLQMLGYADRADAQGELNEGYGAAKTMHALAHGMSLAFADRAKYFGDPDQFNAPIEQMLSSAYLDTRWKTFDPAAQHLPQGAGEIPGVTFPVSAAPLQSKEGQHTTHFSVIDREGNAVAITTTVNDNYGSGFVPPGTGIVMNNEMDDFSMQPGVPNLFGLVGAEANSIAAHKRPLSSMSPTIVRDEQGNARIVIGAAGGPRITTAVFQSLLNRLRFGMSLTDAVAVPRMHQQWRPVELDYERLAFGFDTREKLERLGYKLKGIGASGKVHALERFPNGRTWGVPDYRGEGAAVAE